MKVVKFIPALFIVSLLATSCKKYKEIGDASYSEQTVYMPAGVEGNSVSGIYRVNAVATAGQVYRYIADVTGRKLNIPLAVYRSGIDTKGSIDVVIAANVDTVNKLIAANRFPAVTELLPVDKYTLTPSVNIADGEGDKGFTLSVDLNFLLANLTKKYAIGVTISSAQKKSGAASTAVIYIDPAFLVPVANFTTTVNASTKTVTFSNTSVNSNSWVWEYGDGTPNSTERAVPHTYTAAGSYTVKLTASGALGDFNKSVFTATVVIP